MNIIEKTIVKARIKKPSLAGFIHQPVIASYLLAITINQANALEFTLDNGVTIDLDTTLTYDAQWRLESIDNTILDNGGGGLPGFLTDDGNRNFEKGDITQNRLSFSSDFDINYDSGGFFLRVRGWYDDAYNNTTLTGTKSFQQDGIDMHKSKVELLDAFIYHDFDIGERNLNLRVGEQVVNWGESLFVFGGISSAQGPIDATKINVPGVELKDIFIPIGQVYGEINITKTIFLAAYYQYDWEEVRIDAPGTYFSATDGLGQGSVGDTLDLKGLPITEKKTDEGQWGVEIRYLAKQLNYTEFGFYLLEYNDFVPTPELLPPFFGPQLSHQYFEDIKLLGASFSAVFGDTNVSGEITYRDGQPVQLKVPGAFYFSEAETFQAQVSLIHLISTTVIADSITLVGEIGYNNVLSIDAEGTAQALGIDVNNIDASLDNDRSAAGATISVKADYFNISNGLDLAVSGIYRNDFDGVSSVGFTFTEGTKQLSIKADFNYLNNHSFGLAYVNFITDPDDIIADAGALELGHLNADRDFTALYYKYRF